MDWREPQYKDDNIIINDKTSFNYISDNTKFENCSITIEVAAKSLGIGQALFSSSKFITKQQLVNFHWTEVKLHNTKFVGKFYDNVFGPSDLYDGEEGEILNCDFTEALIDGAQFFETNLNDVSLPKWPCFAILNPIANLTQIQNILQEKYPSLVSWIEDREPEVTILVFDASRGHQTFDKQTILQLVALNICHVNF